MQSCTNEFGDIKAGCFFSSFFSFFETFLAAVLSLISVYSKSFKCL